MSERVTAAWLLLPEYLAEHVLLSAAAMALGLVLSLGLTIAAIRSTARALARARVCQSRPNDTRLGSAGPVLSAAAGGFHARHPPRRRRVLGARFLAVTACVDALLDAARDPQRRDRRRQSRSGRHRGRASRRHDGAPAAVARGVAARGADADGRRPDRRGLGDRSRDVVDACGPDEPRATIFSRGCRSRIGCRCCSGAWPRRCLRCSSTRCSD